MSEPPAAPEPPAESPAEVPRTRFDSSRSNHVIAALIFLVTLLYVFGYPAYVLLLRARGRLPPQPAFDVADLLASLALNVVVMGLGAIAILALMNPGREVLRRRLFVPPDLPHGRAAGIGLAVTIAAMLVYGLALYALDRVVELDENEVVLDLAENLTWPLVLVIAAASSVSEELYFRALLLPRVGIVASSMLFGVVHVTYGNWLQVLVPTALGFVFGWLLLRTRSLAAPIAGHFAWNFLQLAAAMLFADNADLASGP